MILLDQELKAKAELAKLVETLDPILSPHGFVFEADQSGYSSGGGFANGFYRRPRDEIGLIFRGSKLGCPNYASDQKNAGHDELMEALGRGDDCALSFDDNVDVWRLFAKRGHNIVDAFVWDLTHIILPCLENTPDRFRGAVLRAHRARMDRWRSNG